MKNISKILLGLLLLVATESVIYGMKQDRKDQDETSIEAVAGKKQVPLREWEKFNFYEFAENCFKNLKEYSSKRKGSEPQVNSVISSNQFSEVLDDFIQLYTNELSEINFTNPNAWIDNCFPKPGLFKQPSPMSNYRHPYAQKLDLKKNEKAFFKGDIHGSLHSLIRDFLRCNFLDKNLKITDPNQKMIFLGDFIDRGRYGIEVLYLLMILKLKNPKKVFLLRGNHEDPNMWGEHTIRDEIRARFSLAPVELTQVVENILNKLACFYDLLPFVLYLGCQGSYAQCCHGGIEPAYNPKRLLLEKNPNIMYECLLGKNERTQFLDEKTQSDALEHFREAEHMPVGIRTNFYCPGFIWNDFCRYYNTKGNEIYDQSKMVFAGHLCVASFDVVQKYLTWLNTEQLNTPVSGVSLNYIIRGHQHTDYTIMMFDPTFNTKFQQHKVTRQGNFLAVLDEAIYSLTDHLPETQFKDWKYFATPEQIYSAIPLEMHKFFPVFTFMAAPEGVGDEQAHGMHVKFRRDGFGIITIDPDWKNWKLQPYDFPIIQQDNPDGLYCSIKNGDAQDPIKVEFFKNPPKRALNFTKLSFDGYDSFIDTNIDTKVEKYFKQLQDKIKFKRIKDDQAPKLAFPIDSKIKSQTLNHLRIFNRTEEITEQTIRTMLDTFSRFGYTIPQSEYDHYINQVIKPAIEREVQHNNEFYCFYHAHPVKNNSPQNNLLLFQDILKRLYQWGLLNKTQPIPVRTTVGQEYDFPKTLEAFLNQTQECKKDASSRFGCPYCKKETDPWFDCMKCISYQLLAVNFSLFGYLDRSMLGDCSFWYFTQKQCAVTPTYTQKTLEQLFSTCKINPVYLDKIFALSQKYARKEDSGCLLQIFVNKKVIDEFAYFAIPGGKPVYSQIIPDIWDAKKERHTKIAPFLDLYQNNPAELERLMQTFRYDGVFHHYDCSLNLTQGRLFATSPLLYDPEYVKTYRYFTPGYLTQQELDHYNKELDEIFEFIVKDHCRQSVKDLSTHNLLSRTPIEHLGEKIHRLGKQAAQKQFCDMHGLILPATQQPGLKNPTFELEALLFDACPYLSSELATKIQESLKTYGSLKVFNEMTPFMFALSKSNHALVRLILSTQGYDIKPLAEDQYGKSTICYVLDYIKKPFDSLNVLDFIKCLLAIKTPESFDKVVDIEMLAGVIPGLIQMGVEIPVEISDNILESGLAHLILSDGPIDTPEKVTVAIKKFIDLRSLNSRLRDFLTTQEIAKILRIARIDVNNVVNETEQTALHLATQNGRTGTDYIELLIEAGADVNKADKYGQTALQWAARDGYKECIEVLLRAGADVNKADKYGQTALHLASMHRYKECIEVLLRAGADVNKVDNYGQTALHSAAMFGYKEYTELLIRAGTDVNKADKDDLTALHWAISHKHKECTQVLVKHYVENKIEFPADVIPGLIQMGIEIPVEIPDNIFESGLAHLILSARPVDTSEKIFHLIKELIALREQNSRLRNFLTTQEIANILRAAKVNVNVVDRDGETPLLQAAIEDDVECIKILIISGADVNAVGKRGRTALHFTAWPLRTKCIKLLLKAGADVNKADNYGQTPLHWAIVHRHAYCTQVLVKHYVENKIGIPEDLRPDLVKLGITFS